MLLDLIRNAEAEKILFSKRRGEIFSKEEKAGKILTVLYMQKELYPQNNIFLSTQNSFQHILNILNKIDEEIDVKIAIEEELLIILEKDKLNVISKINNLEENLILRLEKMELKKELVVETELVDEVLDETIINNFDKVVKKLHYNNSLILTKNDDLQKKTIVLIEDFIKTKEIERNITKTIVDDISRMYYDKVKSQLKHINDKISRSRIMKGIEDVIESRSERKSSTRKHTSFEEEEEDDEEEILVEKENECVIM